MKNQVKRFAIIGLYYYYQSCLFDSLDLMLKYLGRVCLRLFLGVGFFHMANPMYVSAFQEGFGVNEDNVQDVQIPGTEEDQQENILDVIKRVINYVLGLLALITLILVIYGGLRILFASGDEAAYKNGFTILKNAAIGLAFIAFSWLLVSFIFYFLDLVTA